MDLFGIASNLDIFQRANCGKGKKYATIDRAMIVPAEVLRSEAMKYSADGPLMYLQRYIDQDPDSLYLFIACDPLAGDCSRDMAHEFFDEFFYDVLGMPSTYDRNSGARPIPGQPETAEFGRYDRNMAIHREILPAIDDATFKRYYEEQMQAAAEQLRQMFGVPAEEPEPEEAPAAKDDSDVIDMVDDGSGTYEPSNTADVKSVQAGRRFEVGGVKPIFYAVDFHCPAAMQLGYNNDDSHVAYDSRRGMVGLERGGNRRLGSGGGGRQLGNRRGPNRPMYEQDNQMEGLDETSPERMMREFVETKAKTPVKKAPAKKPAKEEPGDGETVDEGKSFDAGYDDALSEKNGCCGEPGCDCTDECDSFELNESLVKFATRLIRG